MDMQFYWMKNRVKQKYFFVYWKPGIQNMGDYFKKNHPPQHHGGICARYLYMANFLLKIGHKIVHECTNAVLTTTHMVAITPNHTVVQGRANIVRTYGQTHKHHNSNVERMTGTARGSLSVRKTARCIYVPRTI